MKLLGGAPQARWACGRTRGRAGAGRLLPTLVLSCALVAALFAVGCGRRGYQGTPEGAVRAFLERMHGVRGDPADAARVVELLSEKAKANLAERSKRYAAASGRPIAVEAMLVPSRFKLRFEPQRFESRMQGPYALVHVQGSEPGAFADLPCVLEGGRWKLDLALPDLPPVERRPGAE